MVQNLVEDKFKTDVNMLKHFKILKMTCTHDIYCQCT